MIDSTFRFRRIAAALAVIAPAAVIAPQLAQAAGYDTPMLYSARHMGMGGAAISYVDDPSAIFHNPAGLANIQGGAVLADFSPLIGTIQGSPSSHLLKDGSKPGLSLNSNTTFAPFFMAGGAYKLHKFLTVGFAVYPVASAGASYTYQVKLDSGGTAEMEDMTKLAFIDYAPSIAAEILPGLKIGAAYRFSTVDFERKRVNPQEFGDPLSIDLSMKGSNAKGFRLGAQYSAKDFGLGLTYRHRTDTTVSADKGILLSNAGHDLTYEFTLPSKLGLGVHYDGIANLRLAADVEYTWQEQNDTSYMAGTADIGFPVKVANVSKWSNTITARLGGAYRFGALTGRLGYVFDSQASQVRYPSAFGTPPGITQVATCGVGYAISDNLDVSLAGAYRTGTATVTAADIKDNGCAFCGLQGDYKISLFGAYIDAVWRFGGPGKAPAAAAPAPAPEATPAPEPAPAAAPGPGLAQR
ncbi:MAG: outer membrane protein transport protein [Deltaproteobacteria bacterium]|nr:outer membrane protein transport protein [Deltaproteobacteria bacterium]